jgi:hypothetical protein
MKPILPVLFGLILAPVASAQQLTPEFADSYSLKTLNGAVGGCTALAFWAENPNILLAAYKNNFAAGILGVAVTRDASGHIDGFNGGPGTGIPYGFLTPAGGIQGGLVSLPNASGIASPYGTPYAFSSTDGLVGIAGAPLSVSVPAFTPNAGGLAAIPTGVGTGNLALLPYGGTFLEGTLGADVSGNLTLSVADSGIHLVDHATGLGYVTTPVPHILDKSLLVLDGGTTSTLSVFLLDASGLPISGTKRDIATGLSASYSITTDPLTGDLLIADFGDDMIYEIQGFQTVTVPEPLSCSVATLSLLCFALFRRNTLIQGAISYVKRLSSL